MSTDLSFMKNVPVGGSVRLQVRVEMFNVFNKVNYGNPNASFGSAAFGRITGAGVDAPGAAGIQGVVLIKRRSGGGGQEVRSFSPISYLLIS